jgi:hypothetical protein
MLRTKVIKSVPSSGIHQSLLRVDS